MSAVTAAGGERVAPSLLAWAFAAAAFSLSMGMALVTTSFSLLALLALAYARPAGLLISLRRNPPVVMSLLLFLWYGIRTFASDAGWQVAAGEWAIHHELLILPFLVAIPLSEEQLRRAFVAFLAGNLVAVAISYGRFLGLLPELPPPSSYAPPRGPIGGAWLLALAAFACALILPWIRARARVAVIGAAAAMLGVIFFLIAGRTAYVTVVLLTGLILIRSGWRRMAAGFLALALLGALAWNTAPYMRERVVDTFVMPADAARTNSTGIRLEFYRVTAQVIAEAPLLGHGTGSFAGVYARKAQEIASPGFLTSNPHNQYLFLAAETGLPGVLLFLGLLFTAWKQATRMADPAGRMLKGLVLSMAVSCLFNSFLLDGGEGRAFVLLLALGLLAGNRRTSHGAIPV